MLRLPSAVASVRAVALSPSRRSAQCLLAPRQPSLTIARHSSDVKIPRPDASAKPSIKDPKPPVLPGGASKAAPAAPAKTTPPTLTSTIKTPAPNAAATPATPSGSSITAPTQVPLSPPLPSKTQTSPPSGTTPPPPPAPKVASTPPPPPPGNDIPHKKTHRMRNFFFGTSLLAGGLFASGVYYSLRSDNFHDFFTEYVPLGEEAVLYFEEREFRRRFPNALARVGPPRPESPKVTIPRASGATWRTVEPEQRGTDVGKSEGPHLSSKKAEKVEAARTKAVESAPIVNPSEHEPTQARVVAEEPLPAPKGTEKAENVAKPKPDSAPKPAEPAIKELALDQVHDPIVQELVTSVNSLIAAVNSSSTASDYSKVIDSAKRGLEELNNQLGNIKQKYETQISEQLRDKDLEFAKAAQGLLGNVEQEIEDLEHRWRDEFDAEREKLAQGYRSKLQTELERSAAVSEQRLKNELLEQALAMKRQWVKEIEERVEKERGGRLGKLKELEGEVSELEKVALQANSIVDANLKIQHLFSALEAVRTAYESPEQPRPFLREMAALQEVAAEDDLIKAAIASINPLAYQNGVHTKPMLVDRFRHVSEEVRKACLLPEDAGVAGHAASWVLGKLMFRKRGLPVQEDVESILARTETLLEEGDVESAAREMNQLRGWARLLARDWLKEARLLLEVQQAVDVIAAEARVQSLRVQ